MSNLTRTLLSWLSSIEGQVTIHDGVATTADGVSVDLRQGLRDPVSPTEWKVTYQNTPFHYSHPGVLIVTAESKAQAYAVAYDRLTRMSCTVYTGDLLLRSVGVGTTGLLTEEELKAVHGYGVPVAADGRTHVLSIEPHAITAEVTRP